MKKEGTLLIILSMLLFLIPLVSASFSVRNYSIEKIYGPNENIEGWLNISFQSEPGDNKIEASSSFEGSISLIDFLDVNLVEYSCIPDNCEDSYKTEGSGAGTKSFNLGSREEKFVGLKLTGKIDGITSLSFNVSVNNVLSCASPLEIDILDDGIIEWKSGKLTNNFDCGYSKGCFKDEGSREARIGGNTYCEKIKLIKNKKFELGAWIRGNETKPSHALEMELYDLDGLKLASCNLAEPSLNGGEKGCRVELDDEIEGEHYVCLKSEEATYYRIKVEEEESCGFYGSVPSDFSYDYYIFAKGARFDNIGSFVFNQEEYENQGNPDFGEDFLKDYLDSYLENYNKNCTPECVIPIKFSAKNALAVRVSDFKLEYQKRGSPETITGIYDASLEAPKINGVVELDLSLANITAPLTYGNHSLMLYLNDEELLNKEVKIKVEKIPVIKSVFPVIISAGVPVKFVADVYSPANRNISSYLWNFGDDSEEETTLENKATHTYDSVGTYTLDLEVEDIAGFRGDKSFDITVESPEKIANETIIKYKKRLENLTSQVSALPSWYKVEMVIDVELLIEELKTLEREYGDASTSDEYIDIMKNLLELEVPITIKASSLGTIPFFVDTDEGDIEHFEELGAGGYNLSEEEEYKEAIASWTDDNLDIKLEFKYITAYYDGSIENILTWFNLKIKPYEELDEELYVLIQEKNVVFKDKDYNIKEFDDAVGITFSDVKERSLEFVIPDDVPIDELVLYLSPEFSKLTIIEIKPCDFDGICEVEEEETWRNCRADCKPWGWVAVMLIVIIFAALVSYILLQWWYKNRYEKHLFKTKNDLYNIINFISNAKSQGISDTEIKSRLKKAGWKVEQLTYAFKKFKGKEIMPFDFLKLFKKFGGEIKTKNLL